MNRLAARLRERIAASGPISFSAFMESALYDDEDGFYARGAALGARGAFTTAPIAAPFLARALAADLRASGSAWDGPRRSRSPRSDRATARWRPVSRRARRPAARPRAVRARGRHAGPGAGARVPARAGGRARPAGGVNGAIIANEVHDACPAHRLRWPDELLVGDRRRPPLPPGARPAGGSRLGDPLRAAGVRSRAGREYEVAPAQAELQRRLARALERGALVVLDYGEAGAGRYERPVPRLRTYVGGVAGGDPLAAPGTQDITVDVDFGAAARRRTRPRACARCSTSPQAEWLLAHGAGRRARALPRHAPSVCGSTRSATRTGAERRFACSCRSASGSPACA